MLKHFVEYLYPGVFVSETSVEEIAERDTKKVTFSDGCFGFRFFDKSVTVVDGETLTGERKNISNWYYQGEKMTLAEVKEKHGDDRDYHILISNMENNGYNAVVKTKFGQFIPLNDGDTII
ncbi:MAG: hypothetical protein HFJ48_08055 [Clostridia bacterium]|nr:hypothetical protein [Clostridia bacterium]